MKRRLNPNYQTKGARSLREWPEKFNGGGCDVAPPTSMSFFFFWELSWAWESTYKEGA